MIRACVFDAYGTLLDFNSAVRLCASRLGPEADAIAATWRSKQLEHAWASSLRGQHVDFWACTERALDFTLRSHDRDLTMRDDLLAAYRAPEPFADARPALEALRESGIPALVLSNGTPDMLEDALTSAGLRKFVDRCVSIEEAGVYKPAPAAYRLVTNALRLPGQRIGFISANGWDACGAQGVGFWSIWINRDGGPCDYQLDNGDAASLSDAVTRILNGLDEA